MKEKILSIVCFMSFVIVGTGIDSIFDGGFVFWLASLGVMFISGYFLFGSN
jgi:hypothetical protein